MWNLVIFKVGSTCYGIKDIEDISENKKTQSCTQKKLKYENAKEWAKDLLGEIDIFYEVTTSEIKGGKVFINPSKIVSSNFTYARIYLVVNLAEVRKN